MPRHTSNPHQTAFVFDLDTLELPTPGASPDQVRETGALSLPPPDYVPVYTVALRRSQVFSVEKQPRITQPQDVAELVWNYLQDVDRENFVVLFLDTKNRVIGVNTASVGILDSALVHPREVFKGAILANAANIIVAHNHPSGDPTPSPEDRRVTERLVEAGKLLAIEVLDHIIVGSKSQWVSLKERGLM